jgi:hypothetical protein
MFDSPARSASESIEEAVDFRFSITWSTLLAPSSTAQEVQSAKATFALTSVSVPAAQWEMVVPKLVRAPAPRQSVAASDQSFPNLYPAPLFQPRGRNGWILLFGAALLAAIVVPVWRQTMPTRSKAKAVEVATDTRSGGWVRESTSGADSGANQARQLVLYQPSLSATNGQLEFTWKVDDPGVGWIFRAKDVANYYAVRIKVISHAPSLKLSVEHFTVHLGNEGSHSEKVLLFPRNDPALRVRMDVAGPSFTLYLQGNAVDYWTDTRLASGGFGFYEEWHRAAEVRSVRMSFPKHSASGGA